MKRKENPHSQTVDPHFSPFLTQNMAAVTDLNPDALVHMADHLSCVDFVNLSQSCTAMRDAVRLNQTLWASLFSRAYSRPWKALTARSAQPAPQHSWYQLFFETHDACHQVNEPEQRTFCLHHCPFYTPAAVLCCTRVLCLV